MNSITKRWVRGSLFFTLAVVLVAEGIFLYYTISGYYNNANSAMKDRLNTISSQLELFASPATSPEEKGRRLLSAVEQFEDKAQFELMLVDANGRIVVTSSGVLPEQTEVPVDIVEALRPNAIEAGRYIGPNENGEKVMAVTELTPYSSGGIVAIRIVTSLTLLDQSILNLIITSVIFLMAIVLASVISGLYFIRSIVFPLQNVEATASRISEGDFDTRIEYQSNDEIGSLCKTINHMAEELSKSEKMKNEFISSVSHELRTPLTSIKGWTETVGQFSSTDDPNFRRGVEIISSETDRLYDMVEELLDFSRMQSGVVLTVERLDLAAEVEEAVLLAGQRAAGMGIQLDFNPPELPVPVMADSHRIRQVMVNIIDNAIKYSFSGGSIKLEILQDDANAFVSVIDEGRGISPEDLENVKIKFYKGASAVRGSGIGLAVVEEIMKAHGGALEIASELHYGTQVTLRFPLSNKNQKPD